MNELRTGNKDLLRELNRSRIFTCIARNGPLSRRAVARHLNLAPSVVTTVVNEFVQAGLIRELPIEVTSVGRPPIDLTINEEAGYVIGMKVRADSLTAALCNLQCKVMHQCSIPLSLDSQAQPHEVVAAIVECINTCLQQAHVPSKQVLGVGLGLSGVVDTFTGICRYSPSFGWKDVELGPALEFRLRLPVRIDNDVRTLVLAESHFGRAKNSANALLITIGLGVGLGILLQGELVRGQHGGAGEFGHMTVDRAADAPLCRCGKRGCLEAFVGDYALLAAARQQDPEHFTHSSIIDLIEAARQGNTVARALFRSAGQALGQGIANMVNIFDTDLVLLGGEGLQAGSLLLEPMQASMQKHLFDSWHKQVKLVECSTDDVDWARGAASLILDELLRPPLYTNNQPLIIDTLLSLHQQKMRK